MNFKHYLIVFITTFGMSFFMASCLNEDNKIPPNCYDGILNNGEEGIDCGGPCAKECDHCINGIWEPNKGETWRDCGGVDCPPCAQCANGIKDGDEVGIDCGGSCGGCELLCGDGLLNGLEDEIDCQYDVDGIIESCPHCPTCVDGVMNGNEHGIDCGAPGCSPCCSTGSCRNGIRDGDEFWTDCGGGSCYACADTILWKVGSGNVPFHFSEVVEADIIETTETMTVSVGPSNLEGTITVMFKKLGTAGQSWSITGANATITYTDALGNLYLPNALANPATTGNVVLVKAPTTASMGAGTNPYYVPDNALDGCKVPHGTYTYYRVSFSAQNLYHATDLTALPITISEGLFQFTFHTP